MLGGTFELERRVKKLTMYGKFLSIGPFLLLAFIPGYMIHYNNVIIAAIPQ